MDSQVNSRVDSMKSAFLHWLGGKPDDDVLRWLYRALLVATLAVLALDYADFQAEVAAPSRCRRGRRRAAAGRRLCGRPTPGCATR